MCTGVRSRSASRKANQQAEISPPRSFPRLETLVDTVRPVILHHLEADKEPHVSVQQCITTAKDRETSKLKVPSRARARQSIC